MPDYDSPWKEAMDRYFGWFLLFFFPKIHALLDWSHEYEPLDSELRKLAREAETGKRHIDKLIKAKKLGTGDMRLVHVEVQGRKEEHFAHRMHVYNYRIEDVYSHPVMTLVLLTDEDPEWKPKEYVFAEGGCQRSLGWPIFKLLDWAEKLDELANAANLFGSLAAAHLVAQQASTSAATRKEWKLRLLRGLYSRNLDGEDVRQWSRYIDWVLVLPREDEDEVDRAIHELEKENEMPFVTSFERLANERAELAMQQKLQLLLQQQELAMQQDLEKATAAMQQKMQHDLEKATAAMQQKMQQEAQQATLAGLYRTIEVLLDVRFRAEGLALMTEVRQKTDVALLERLVEALRTGAALDDIRNRLAS